MLNRKHRVVAALAVGLLGAEFSYSATSWLVSSSPTGLVYSTYANQNQANAVNKIPDFSLAGYQGGGVTIPFVPAKVTVSPSGGDDTTAIQSAINQVSAMPVGPDGFRGAVLLEAGEYTVSSTLTVSKSGVVVRGAGSQDNGGTRITFTARVQDNLFEVSGGGSISETGGTRVSITDSYVPVGATQLNVSDASGFSVGDRIMVKNLMNAQWITDIGMDAAGWSWDAYQLEFRRQIISINGNEITMDAPLVQAIEDQYGGGDIYKYVYSGELENIGFESLRLESTYAGPFDEQHGWTAINIQNVQNGWVRQVTARHFGYSCVSINSLSQKITVEDCAQLDPKSEVGGGRRYSFGLDDSHLILVQRCLTRAGRHDYVSGSRTPGPNAFVDCRADNTYADIGPHFKYATGQIYDNVMGGQINVRDTGGAHGWTGAQILFWNCDGSSIICDTPTAAMSWCIGSKGTKTEGPGNRAFGIWDSEGISVTPRSLYYTQLNDRLGVNAMNNVILPQQKAGDIWDALYSWAGDGLLLDDLVVLADEEVTPTAGVALDIRGVVRNLPMLDNGVTVSWTKLYGPGTVNFGSSSSLETTATFSQDGVYVLKCTVDDGVITATANLTVEVGAGSSDTTAPSAPTGLAATPGNGSVALNWAANSEGDLAGYNVYRSTTSNSYVAALATWLTSTNYVDESAIAGTEYYYAITALDTSANESALSTNVAALTGGGNADQQTGKVTASDNAWVEDTSGVSQPDVDYLRAKNTWGSSTSRMPYLRFGLSGENQIGGYDADTLTSVSLSIYIMSNEGDVANDLQVYALVDSADADGAGTANLSESQWTRSASVNPLIDTNLPQGDVDPASSGLCTAMLGSHTFADVNLDNQETGVLNISLSLSLFKTLINNDSNGEITLILRSTSGGTAIDIGAIGNSGGYLEPTLNIVAPPSAPVGVEATAGDGQVTLGWADNPETNIESYSVYRSNVSSNYGGAMATNIFLSSYVDDTAVNGNTYYYKVTATDTNGNESAQSAEVSATPAIVLESYDQWKTEWGTDIGASTNDFDSDGMNNLCEYALGGDPTNGLVRGTLPTFTKTGNIFIYVHPQRSDDTTLVYTVETRTNLVHGAWTNAGYTVTGTNVTGGTLNFVTNEVSTVDDGKFLRLRIELL